MNLRKQLIGCVCLQAASLMPMTATADSEEHAHAAHRHHLSMFLGATTVSDDNHTGLTYGIDYEYVLSPRIGVGAIIERAEGEIDATSVIAILDIHVSERFVMQVGAGIEFEDDKQIAIGRVGAYYEFDLGDNIMLAPSLGYDISEEADAFVFGIMIGRKF